MKRMRRILLFEDEKRLSCMHAFADCFIPIFIPIFILHSYPYSL